MKRSALIAGGFIASIFILLSCFSVNAEPAYDWLSDAPLKVTKTGDLPDNIVPTSWGVDCE